jgi:hypothetical protein
VLVIRNILILFVGFWVSRGEIKFGVNSILLETCTYRERERERERDKDKDIDYNILVTNKERVIRIPTSRRLKLNSDA